MIAKSIFGPPGTGKTTRVLTMMADLKDAGVDPRGVIFMSFTRAAAGEALRRLGMKKSDNVCTLHSMCYRLLGLSPSMVVNEQKMQTFCEDAGIDMSFGAHNQTEYDECFRVQQYSRNAMVDLDEAYIRCNASVALSELYAFSAMYDSWKAAYGLYDYDDMLLGAVKNRLFPRGSHMIIDEAQDLTPLQWQVIDHFCSHKNTKEVCIAGDSDQALYTFSGVDASGMRKFEERFCGEREVLSQSWRVPRSVHKIAMSIISGATDRDDIEYSPRPDEGSVEVLGDANISSLFATNDKYMVLCRTNYIARRVAGELRGEGIRFHWEGEGNAWRKDAGICLRIWAKLSSGMNISQKERDILARVLTLDAKRAINACNAAVFKKHWSEVMILSDEAMEHISVHGEDAVLEEPLVEISTIHGAKGKECDNVILLTELTDRVRESMESDSNTEARVFYVGATRAINNLIIVGGSDGYPI